MTVKDTTTSQARGLRRNAIGLREVLFQSSTDMVEAGLVHLGPLNGYP